MTREQTQRKDNIHGLESGEVDTLEARNGGSIKTTKEESLRHGEGAVAGGGGGAGDRVGIGEALEVGGARIADAGDKVAIGGEFAEIGEGEVVAKDEVVVMAQSVVGVAEVEENVGGENRERILRLVGGGVGDPGVQELGKSVEIGAVGGCGLEGVVHAVAEGEGGVGRRVAVFFALSNGGDGGGISAGGGSLGGRTEGADEEEGSDAEGEGDESEDNIIDRLRLLLARDKRRLEARRGRRRRRKLDFRRREN